jgi:hypothetical protein
MAAYNLIATTTVGAAGAASIVFSGIPQTYTDLVIKLSARSSATGGSVVDSPFVDFNGLTTNQSARWVRTVDGSTVASQTDTRTYLPFSVTRDTATASVFGNGELYIPNYAGSTNKSFSADGVAENNATAAGLGLTANLWSNTAAITSITLTLSSGGNFMQHSSASLYGIKNS